MAEYANFIKGAGFAVKATDNTQWFIDILTMELENFDKIKSEFLKSHSEKDYNDIVDGWKIKLVRCAEGTQKWSLFEGFKSK